jgi:hypothetical protein
LSRKCTLIGEPGKAKERMGKKKKGIRTRIILLNFFKFVTKPPLKSTHFMGNLDNVVILRERSDRRIHEILPPLRGLRMTLSYWQDLDLQH